jgi:hypothetical protein
MTARRRSGGPGFSMKRTGRCSWATYEAASSSQGLFEEVVAVVAQGLPVDSKVNNTGKDPERRALLGRPGGVFYGTRCWGVIGWKFQFLASRSSCVEGEKKRRVAAPNPPVPDSRGRLSYFSIR